MPVQDFDLQVVISTLENETRLGRALFYPEVSAFDDETRDLDSVLQSGVLAVREELSALVLSRRQRAGELTVREVRLNWTPAHEIHTCWSEPVSLRFHAVCWRHGDAASIAYVPALNIEVITEREEDLEQRLAEQIHSALCRRGTGKSLRDLVWLERCESVDVHSVPTHAVVRSPREIAAGSQDKDARSVLRDIATDLTTPPIPPAFELDDVVLRVAECLSASPPQSVLLVGPSGTGKTAAVRELVRQRQVLGLGSRPFWSTSGARIVAGMCGFGAWQQRCQGLCQEAAKTHAVLHLGNLLELVQVGQYVGNDQGVGHFMRPHIARGEFAAVVECLPEQLPILDRVASNVLTVFSTIEVKEPSLETGRSVLKRFIRWRAGRDVLDQEALVCADRLHRRYASYSAYPGRPLRFLQTLLADAPDKRSLTAADVTGAFSRETGLPLWLLEDGEPLDLDAARNWFASRVMGQSQAVDLVVDLLATVKAGLTRPGRPIASLLFIGPTGVGKTEMAKALAEFLYHDPARMLRIDMSEYADPTAADRLVGLHAQSEGLLTSKVREQPFGVVLLDEFEKAHPRFYDLLLQVLGEGRLTDAAGRLADFRNAVVIMTSNLGTETFGRAPAGFERDSPALAAEAHFTREVQRFVRPELFNRIDRIVPFLPLQGSTISDIARRELDLVQRRAGILQRDVHLESAPEVVELLARLGYDPRYGARPIKRAIDRHFLVPLSAGLNDFGANVPLVAQARAEDDKVRITVRSRQAETSSQSTSLLQESRSRLELATQVSQQRREALRARGCQPILEMQNELVLWEREQQHGARKRERSRRRASQEHSPHVEQPPRIKARQAVVQHLQRIVSDSTALEDRVLVDHYAGTLWDTARVREDLEACQADFRSLLIEMLAAVTSRTDRVTLVVYGESPASIHQLAAAYAAIARKRAFSTQCYEIVTRNYQPPPSATMFLLGDRDSKDKELREQANGTSLQAIRIGDPADFLAADHGQVGIALCLTGRVVNPLLAAEEGMHVFRHEQDTFHCFVHCSDAMIADYQPLKGADRKGGISKQSVRRVYNAKQLTIEDTATRERLRWSGHDVDAEIDQLVETTFQAQLRELIRR